MEGSEYVLDTDQKFEDVAPLKSALEHEKTHRKQATDKVKVLEDEVRVLTARAGSAGDLENSWKQKLDTANAEAKQREDALNGQLRTLLVDNVATTMAAEISTAPSLILPHIQKRLTIESVDGKMITRVLDKDGKASALSVNELKTEFLANKDFAPIITASKASGGGAAGGKGAPAGGKQLKDMSEAEKVAYAKADPDGFKAAAAELAKTSGFTGAVPKK